MTDEPNDNLNSEAEPEHVRRTREARETAIAEYKQGAIRPAGVGARIREIFAQLTPPSQDQANA